MRKKTVSCIVVFKNSCISMVFMNSIVCYHLVYEKQVNRRYHLELFNRGGPPTNSRELFNRRHSSLRSVIERTFGVWKAKWRILDRKHPKYEVKKWIKIVTSTMALHNYIRDSQQEDSDFRHWEIVESYEQHGDENDGHVPYVPTGDRVMENIRDSITTEMAKGTRLPY